MQIETAVFCLVSLFGIAMLVGVVSIAIALIPPRD